MRALFSRWALDSGFILALLALSAFGVAMIYSTGQLNVPSPVVEGVWIRQLVWFAFGLTAFTIISRISSNWIEWASVPAYVLAVVLLAVTLVVGTGRGTAAGVTSFLQFGGFQFQPAEVAKIATILALARLMASRLEAPGHGSRRSWQLTDVIGPSALVGLPLVLVLLQPDLGTAMAFVGILMAVLFWSGIPLTYLFLLVSPAIALVVSFNTWLFSAYMVALIGLLYLRRSRLYTFEYVAVLVFNLAVGTVARLLWDSLAPYQQNRVLVFLDPGLDPQQAGYHLVQSKVAIGSGGLTGKGFTLGTQKRFNFLPEQHTDFIFAVIGEEFGFVGTLLVLSGFSYVLFRLIRMATGTGNHFASFVLFGIFGAWITHVFVNTGMTVGLVPVTGIPLPFISYGGSFLLMCWVAAALAVRVARQN
ncbi:MAG: rod shape-determining protein RodA [Gammaproteobacteria bacterium]|nr:rod shape-determining protein RodA [Gammaproteobacteria bacterium]MDE0650942.1 rod shape-determining protein RodA [Gammaproteobacteria bacterium]MXW10949.1 rod shape-determining protein RodA [Gammaproteobacteria bacterium]MYC52240.1 rod shape-determining protein RodA [Gammaproteobacteria bacterium]